MDKGRNELSVAIAACRRWLAAVAVFSFAVNILYLSASIYMLQVYDRVIPSGSVVTLIMLTIMLLVSFGVLAGLENLRARILVKIGARLERLLGAKILGASIDTVPPLGGQPLRDFDTVRLFITGPGIHSILDLPWTPIYLIAISLLHPVLGLFALGCVSVLLVLALTNEWLVRPPLTEASAIARRNQAFSEMALRNAETIRALGMLGPLSDRWQLNRTAAVDKQASASDRAAAISSLIRFFRLSMQSLVLGLGAYLAIEQLTTAGAIFAASLLLARALQPIEQIVALWRNLVAARGAYQRLYELFVASNDRMTVTDLPPPTGRVSVERLSYAVPGKPDFILRNVSFRIEPGEAIGIVGPSGAGKSTLVRQLVNASQSSAGLVRLDGADIRRWPAATLGRWLGYLPQDVELFDDSVAANIGRFQIGMDAEIIAAARLAGIHDMILRLPEGYDTRLGEAGAVLSSGHRQRVGLARAIFGNPKLVVLDEPSSSLDAEGDAALAVCLGELKRRGTTVVVASHRAMTLRAVDKILVLRDGAIELFGERSEVLTRLGAPEQSLRPEPRAVAAVGA